ncbi:MAG: 50S ribosomal protein L20 [Bdellovibrionales bacterium]|nr:50S ribosomal protein L20 [Bdellovibrionales bacterium]
MRVKRGVKARRRRNKILKRASGFISANSRAFSHATEKADRAMQYMYRDRKVMKRDMRQLWTTRINAGVRLNGTTYSRFIGALNKSDITLDRKVLADMAVHDAAGFATLVKKVMGQATA